MSVETEYNHPQVTQGDQEQSGPISQQGDILKKRKKKSKKKALLNKNNISILRTTLRNNTELTNIADNKANVLLSLNALMLTFLVPMVLPNIDLVRQHSLEYPLVLLVITCLVTVYLSVLVLRPGKFSGQIIEVDKNNQLSPFFFGNFDGMKKDAYLEYFDSVLNNERLVQKFLSNDFYHLGLRLAEKMKLTRMAFNIFMLGARCFCYIEYNINIYDPMIHPSFLKKASLLFLIVSFLLTKIDGKDYNDGPYIFLENGSLKTIWVLQGDLYQKSYSNKEIFTFDEQDLPYIQLAEKTKWESKTKGKYKTSEKIVAISDIHGQYEVFRSLLEKHNVIDGNENWSFGKGHMVVVGDVMDRGDEVMECLWMIYKLEQQANAVGGKVHFLLGNHELMVMNGNLAYLHPKYRYTSALVKKPYNEFFSKETALGKWLASKNVILQLNDILYVHGGLSQQALSLDLNVDQINSLFKKKIYYKSEEDIDKDPVLTTLYYGDGPLWYRGYAYPYSYNKESVDQLFDFLGASNIVVGHTSLPEIKALYNKRIILIDSSIKLGESGELLLIREGEFYVGDFDGNEHKLKSEEEKVEERQSLFEYLSSSDAVTIHLSERLSDIKKTFEKTESPTDGTIQFIVNGQQLPFSASFEPGGKSRRKICKMPPLKMDLKKEELEAFNFIKESDDLKIVLQCNQGGSSAENIKKEKFIYDLYNLFSPYSKRGKVVRVKEYDNKKYFEGFLLEDDTDFERRTGTEVLKNKTIATHVLNQETYLRMCLFQFMIANADWSARKGHNTRLFRRIEDNALLIVPYDFDYCGLIDNDYAVPPENLPIRDVTDRYFMDKSITIEQLQPTIDFYVEKEAEVYDLINNSTYLSEGSRKRIAKFIEAFYKIIKDNKKRKKVVHNR